MADDYAGSTATTGGVSVNSTRTGSIETTTDTDWFRVTLVAGATYRFDLEGAATGRGTLADPFLRLRDSAGNSITSDDDGGTGLNSRISNFVATYSGTYYLSVGPSDSTTGTYRLAATETAPPPSNTIYTITPSATSMYEGGRITFTIKRTGDQPSETVYFSAWSGTASYSEGDYRMLNGSKPENIAVSFSSGEDEETVTLAILKDDSVDAGEQFRAIVQKNPPSSDPAVNVAQTGYITITDPNTTYSLTPSSTTVSEGSTTITFTVTRTGDRPDETIYASTLLDSASSPGDYQGFIDKAVPFVFGDGSETFVVTLINDTLPEPTEHFRVMIGRAGAQSAQALDISDIFITDDDSTATPTFTIGDAGTVTEGGNAVFTVTMSGTITAPVTVWYSTLEGTAKAADGDYAGTFVDKALTFNPGGSKTQTISIPILAEPNNPPEAAESFKVGLQHTQTGSAFTTGTATIAANGGAQPAADDYRDEDTDTSSPLGGISLLDPVRTGAIGPADSNDTRGDKDVFKVTLTQGQTYVFTMTGATVNGFSPLSESIFTIRKAGSFSAIQATSTEGSSAVMEFYAEMGGDYYIRTGSGGPTYTTDQGGYRLEMRQPSQTSTDFDPGNTVASAFSISSSISGTGAYSYRGQVGSGDPADVFKLVAPSAGQLTVDLTNLSADVDVSILDSSGHLKPGAVSDNAKLISEYLSITLSAGETIYLNVTPFTSSPAAYTLNARFGSAPPPPIVPVLPSSSSLIGNHLNRTLAEFAAGAYGDGDGSTARSHLIAEGWSFYDSENVQGTSLSSLPWSGIFYNNSVAQAIVARSADGLVISFRGTNGWADVPHWLEMDEHLKLFGDLVAAVNELIMTDKTIRHVYVTGHSLGAAMVDPFMATHPNFQRNDGTSVDFRAITFAHPDFQTAGTEAIFNGALTAYRSGLPSGLYKTFKLLHDGVPDFGPDSRVTSYHNYLDPVRFADFPSDGLVPSMENLIRFTGPVGSAHDKQLYVYAADFLARSGVGDSVVSLSLNGSKKNEFLIPSPGSEHSTITSLTGGKLMVGGTGDDIYVVTANGSYSGDTIIEYTGASAVMGDTLRLTSGFGAFNGNVRLVPTQNGMDLLVYPVSTGVAGHDLPYIRIYNHFTLLGGVEWIEWAGKRIALPASVDAISGWNNTYYKSVTPTSFSYVERPDGTLFASVSATGGPGNTDTASFHGLKDMRVTADLSQRIGKLWDGINTVPGSLSLQAAAAVPEGIPIDLADMENIVGSDGADEFIGSNVANGLKGGNGDDRLSGGLGNDYLEGDRGSDILSGDGGEDLLDGGPGADALTGGPGTDFYFVDDAADVIVENASEGAADRVFASVSYTLGTAVHVEILSTMDDTGTDSLILTGNELNNRIIGNAGANTLHGMGGTDLLEGLAGDDLYFVEAGDIVIETANAGTDEVRTSLADTTAPANVENLTGLLNSGQVLRGNALDNVIAGGAGADRMAGGLGNDVYLVGAGDLALEKPGEGIDEVRTALASYALRSDVEWLTGTSATGQALTGNTLANVITGGVGNDRIDGGAGADRMDGGLGDDVYYVDDFRDVVIDSGGTDEVRTRFADTTAAAGIEKITGLLNSGQVLRGNALDNIIAGGAGADRMAGGLGNDVYLVGAGDLALEKFGEGIDEVRTALASYALRSDVEWLTGTSATGQVLTGNLLANVITGGSGNDRIDGGAGADRMEGGLGADNLTGGSGADIFAYASSADSTGSSTDRILDFAAGIDKIDLGKIDANSNAAGDQAFSWIGSGAFSGSAGQLRAYQQGGLWIIEGDTDGDGVADLVVSLVVQGPAPLGAGDFFL
ncbi:MAG: Calx-beta domain-containing protein [Allosphingosinicella sp.]